MAAPIDNDVYRRAGQRLRALRVSREMTQAQVAALLNVSPQQYAKYEDAQTKCTLAVVLTLASYYGVGVETILTAHHAAPATVPGNEVAGWVAQQSTGGDEDLLSRLVTAYLHIPDHMEKTRVVELIEAIRIAAL